MSSTAPTDRLLAHTAVANGSAAVKPAKRRDADLDRYQEAIRRETDAAFSVVKRNALLDFVGRAALLVIGVASLLAAVGYTLYRSDSMVGVLLSDDPDRRLSEDRIITLTLPVILLLLLAAAAFGAAFLLQTRGGAQFERDMQDVSRLRREAEGGVSRIRTATHALEEFYGNARKAFRLQLYLARALFVVCIVLFCTAVFDALAQDLDVTTLALAGGSLISLLLAAMSGASTKVGSHLADATQIQLVVGGTARQVNAIEDHMYKALERDKTTPEVRHDIVMAGTRRIEEIVASSLLLIQSYAEPPGDHSEQEGS
jgi:hypothetical protein